jgi:hypothetical protein
VNPLILLKSQVENKWNKNILSVIRLNNSRYRLGGFLAQWPLSGFTGYKGLIISPLSSTPFIPDTVVFYGTPLQILYVSHAFSVEGKYVPRGVAAGFGEGCWAAGLFPLQSKKPVFLLGGFGERVFARLKDYEMIMGMPGKLAFYVDEYLYAAGGEHNLKAMMSKSYKEVNEDILPGWRDVRNKMKYKRI